MSVYTAIILILILIIFWLIIELQSYITDTNKILRKGKVLAGKLGQLSRDFTDFCDCIGVISITETIDSCSKQHDAKICDLERLNGAVDRYVEHINQAVEGQLPKDNINKAMKQLIIITEETRKWAES